MNRRRTALRALIVALVLALVFVMVFSGLKILETTIWEPQNTVDTPQSSKTITVNGVDYFPRQDVTVVLIMGIDELGPVVSSGSYRNTGEVDAVSLLILDETNSSYSILTLNRDTMLQMPALGVGGKEAGSFYGQLALSHTYGEGLADSAENTQNTVSQFLGGITIDHYVAVNMGAIPTINDAVGGVTVNVTEDFSAVDPSITMGQQTLWGEQALHFVRSREDLGDQLNLSRMNRHEQYMEGLISALTEKLHQDNTFVLTTYDQVSDYIVTDCSVNVISSLMNKCADYSFDRILSPEGENVLGDRYYEFYVDEEKLDALILDLFYTEK